MAEDAWAEDATHLNGYTSLISLGVSRARVSRSRDGGIPQNLLNSLVGVGSSVWTGQMRKRPTSRVISTVYQGHFALSDPVRVFILANY